MISVGIFHREPSYFFCRFKIRYGFGVWVIEKQDGFTVIRFTRCLNLFYLRLWAFEAFLLRIPKDAFLFPRDFFSLGKSSFTFFRVEQLSIELSSTTGLSPSKSFREMSTLLSSDGSELCSTICQHRTAKIFPGLVRARSHSRLSQWSYGNPIPQKLTLLEGWVYLKCLHGKKLALLGGLPYQRRPNIGECGGRYTDR